MSILKDKKILVIDDESVIRKSFELTFEDTEIEVLSAQGGQEGIELHQKHAANLIFLDLKMPEMNGIETLKRIREFDTDTAIYIFTAFHQDFIKQLNQAAEKGLEFEIIQKPLDGETLRQLVLNIFR